MVNRISIVSPELTVPVLDAPRLKPVEISSGLEAVAGGFDQLARARRIGEASDAQIGFTQAFSDLDNEVRAAPWDQKQALFDERVGQIREQWLDPVTDPQVRQAIEPEFDRTLGIYRAHTVHDAFTGETAYHLASADANADDMARRIAFARSPQERRMLVDQGATPYDNLAIMGVIDGPQRQAKIERFLNAADVYAVGQAIADPAKDPAAVAQALVDPNRYPHLDADQRDNFKLLARNEAIRRRSAAAADASVAGAATASDAANAAKADVQSRLATGRPLDPVSQDAIDALPSDRQSAYRTAAANAGKIFAAVGDMRTLSSDGIQSALETVKPLGADVHAQAQDLANGIMADRANDPANAMRASIPLVAKAWTAYAHDALPENLQAALKLSRAAQTALGIAPDQQRLMPGDVAESEARAILSAAPSDQLSTLRDLQSRAGIYASTVLGQIDRFFAPQLRDAASQPSDLAGDLLWRQAVAAAGPNGPMPDLQLLANPTPQPADDQTPDAQSGAGSTSDATNGSAPAQDSYQVSQNGPTATSPSGSAGRPSATPAPNSNQTSTQATPAHYDCSLGVGQSNCRIGTDLRPGDTVDTGQHGTVTIQDGSEFKISPALSRGGASMLSDEEIAAVVFNETRSYSGQGLARARADMAHAIVNGDERLGTLRPVAAATTAKVPPSERSAYNECLEAVRQARAERSLGYDSTNGAIHFNQRGNAHLGNFQRGRFQTQSGPFTNSFPTKGPNGLPATGVYILTYE